MNHLVSICMITYQHAQFFEEAIQNLLDQETNFPFEIVVRDDASTDGTTELISTYAQSHPNKIRLLPGKENLGMINNFKTVIKACKGKYIAFCEGDDYWIDNRKLDNQISMMEGDPDIGLIYTNYRVINEEGKPIIHQKYTYRNMPEGYILQEIIRGEFPYTVTVCARRETFIDKLDQIILEDYRMGDYPLWLHIAKSWKIAYLPSVTSVYRRHSNSFTANAISTQSKLNFNNSWVSILNDFLEREKLDDPSVLKVAHEEINKRIVQNYLISSSDNDRSYSQYWQQITDPDIKLRMIRGLQLIPWIGPLLIHWYYQLRKCSAKN